MPLKQPPKHLSYAALCELMYENNYIIRSLESFIERHPDLKEELINTYVAVEAFEEADSIVNKTNDLDSKYVIFVNAQVENFIVFNRKEQYNETELVLLCLKTKIDTSTVKEKMQGIV